MKLRRQKGFSLMEVVISFVLLSFIAVMVGISITDAYTISSKLDEMPNTYYAAQDMAEKTQDDLSSKVKTKYTIKNEILNTAPDLLDPTLWDRLDDVEDELRSVPTETVNLFGKDVELYKYTSAYTSSNGLNITLHGAVVNAKTLDRPVPIIDSVSIRPVGAAESSDLYNSSGITLSASVDYNSKNSSYCFKELYQWYVCTGNFHTVEFADGSRLVDGEPLYSTVYTTYPNYFTLIAGANKDTITLDGSFYGKFIICVATPLSVEGAMGESVVSNYVYLSALPALSGGSYRMLVDASQIPVNFDSSGEVSISTVNSRYPAGTQLVSVSGAAPRIDLAGEPTDTDINSSITGMGSYSRFIRFNGGSSLAANGLSYGETYVFAVAKSTGGYGGDFLYADGAFGGFDNNIYISSGGGDTGWQIVAASFPSCYSFEIGNQNVNVAELIVVSTPSASDISSIWNYLSAKYRITS